MDSRIGSKFLKAGPGFGGSCFKRYPQSCLFISLLWSKWGSWFWQETVAINSWQQTRIYKEIVAKLFSNLADKKIAILGFAFKENTNDTRESPAINICRNLLNEGAFLSIHDCKVKKKLLIRTYLVKIHLIKVCGLMMKIFIFFWRRACSTYDRMEYL